MSTTATDFAATVSEQVLGVVSQAQDLTVDVVRAAADVLAPIIGSLPKPAFADQLPNPQEYIDASFAFAGQLLNRQRTFLNDIAEVLTGLVSDGTETTAAEG